VVPALASSATGTGPVTTCDRHQWTTLGGDATNLHRIVSRTECRGRLRPAGATGGLRDRGTHRACVRTIFAPTGPSSGGSPVVAAASFAPSSFAFTSARNLRFTDPAMMYRETIDNGGPRGRGGGPRWCAMGRISGGAIRAGMKRILREPALPIARRRSSRAARSGERISGYSSVRNERVTVAELSRQRGVCDYCYYFVGGERLVT